MHSLCIHSADVGVCSSMPKLPLERISLFGSLSRRSPQRRRRGGLDAVDYTQGVVVVGVVDGTVRKVGQTAGRAAAATTKAAGAVGGAAVNGVVGAVAGAAAGVQRGASTGSYSMPLAVLTLGALGASGLVEWPLVLAVGGGALLLRQTNRPHEMAATPAKPTPATTAPTKSTESKPTRSSQAKQTSPRRPRRGSQPR